MQLQVTVQHETVSVLRCFTRVRCGFVQIVRYGSVQRAAIGHRHATAYRQRQPTVRVDGCRRHAVVARVGIE